MRGLLALGICVFHFRAYSHYYPLEFVRNLDLCVDFFFVLSGFILMSSYGPKLAGKTESLLPFVVRRIGRLWPLHVAILGAFVSIELAELLVAKAGFPLGEPPFDAAASKAPEAILTNALLIHALGMHEGPTWNGPSWSISTEMMASLVFVLVLVLPGRRLLVGLAIALASAILLWALNGQRLISINDYALLRCLYGFFVGVLTFALWERIAPWLERQTGLVSIGQAVAIGTMLVLFAVTTDGSWQFVMPLLFGAIVILLASDRGPSARLLQTAPMRRIGMLSYSIYLVHALIITVLARGLSLLTMVTGESYRQPYQASEAHDLVDQMVFGSKLAGDLALIPFLTVVLVAASITYYLVEKPGRRLFYRWADQLETFESRGQAPRPAALTRRRAL